MDQPAKPAPPANTLASAFQEAFTAILRVRSQRQQVGDAEVFRTQIRRALQTAMQEARATGYSSDLVQMSVFAVVAYLDESVLNLQSPIFADWARRPLQEELFGGHTAGELFFRNLKDLLGREDARNIADTLEVYCLCLLLGYKGRYGFGGSGELESFIRQAREKIARIRGNANFLAATAAPDVRRTTGPDRWTRALGIAAAALVVLALVTFGGLEFALASGAAQVQNSSNATQGNTPGPVH